MRNDVRTEKAVVTGATLFQFSVCRQPVLIANGLHGAALFRA